MRSSNSVIVGGAVAFTALALFAGCSSPAKTTSSASGQAAEVTITMSEFRFSPDQLDLKAGQTIRFVVINQGTTKHEIMFGDQQTQDEHEKMMTSGNTMQMAEPGEVEVDPGQTKDPRVRRSRYARHAPLRLPRARSLAGWDEGNGHDQVAPWPTAHAVRTSGRE